MYKRSDTNGGPIDAGDMWQGIFVVMKLTGYLTCSWWWFLAILGVELMMVENRKLSRKKEERAEQKAAEKAKGAASAKPQQA